MDHPILDLGGQARTLGHRRTTSTTEASGPTPRNGLQVLSPEPHDRFLLCRRGSREAKTAPSRQFASTSVVSRSWPLFIGAMRPSRRRPRRVLVAAQRSSLANARTAAPPRLRAPSSRDRECRSGRDAQLRLGARSAPVLARRSGSTAVPAPASNSAAARPRRSRSIDP
jgi:hypothetical protein